MSGINKFIEIFWKQNSLIISRFHLILSTKSYNQAIIKSNTIHLHRQIYDFLKIH